MILLGEGDAAEAKARLLRRAGARIVDEAGEAAIAIVAIDDEDEALAAIIGDPLDELHVLHVDGTPAGFAELDRRQRDEIELVQFGLVREFIGQGLGKWFLQWTIDKAWSYQPKRFWLHTCTLDHPAAVPNYLKAGFVLYKTETIRREL